MKERESSGVNCVITESSLPCLKFSFRLESLEQDLAERLRKDFKLSPRLTSSVVQLIRRHFTGSVQPGEVAMRSYLYGSEITGSENMTPKEGEETVSHNMKYLIQAGITRGLGVLRANKGEELIGYK